MDLYGHVGAVITAHQAWRSWGENQDGLRCNACDRRYPSHQYDEHIAQAVGDLLIDLAGTGQLLASIDQIAKGFDPPFRGLP